MFVELSEFVAIFFTVVYSQITRVNADVHLSYIFDDIRDNISPYKVNIIVPSFKHLPLLARKIIERTNLEFASNNHDFEEMSQILNANWTNDRFNSYAYEHALERVSLTTGIIELKNESDVSGELFTGLKYFRMLNPLSRGKYLLHVISERELRFQGFFRRAWSKKFLDLTIIEWIQRNRRDVAGISSNQSDNCVVFVHSYNPFSDIFSKTELNALTELFPNKLKNLHGVILTACDRPEEMTETLMEPLHSTIRTLSSWKLRSSFPPNLKQSGLICDFFQTWYVTASKDSLHDGWNIKPYGHLKQAFIPQFHRLHFYVLPRSVSEMTISWLAILTYGGLFFTALIFTIWVRLLDFREPNWSFINILTAQMGGDLKTLGRTRLSKQIFQMTIYIATFIIVTVGTDYMLELFIMSEKIPEIRSLEDLADSSMELFMNEEHLEYYYMTLLGVIDTDPRLQKIIKRIRPRKIIGPRQNFCMELSANAAIDGKSMNLCIAPPALEGFLDTFYGESLIQKIQEPIVTSLQYIQLGKYPFFKPRLEELIGRFFEVGLLEKWVKDASRRRESKIEYDWAQVKKQENEKVPLQDQLSPILAVGFASGILALIGEVIWKTLIEKTELGKLVGSFFSDSRSNSSNRAMRTSLPPPFLKALQNCEDIELKETDHRNHSNVKSTREFLSSREDQNCPITVIADFHQHGAMLQSFPSENTTGNDKRKVKGQEFCKSLDIVVTDL